MFAGEPAELGHTNPDASKHLDKLTADRSRNRPILLYAAPGCGAENLIRGLSYLKSFTLVCGSHFPISDAARAASCFGTPPLLPGLHFLADYRTLLKALRRMMDSIIDIAPGPTNSARVIYSPDNISNIPILRQLYPDALHVHLVRDVSWNPLRIAAEANRPAWSLCKRWRQAERAFLNSPPLPTQVTVRYEELEHAPAETVDSFIRLAGLSLTAADHQTFSQQFPSANGEAYFNHRSRYPFCDQDPSVRRILERMAAHCAAVYCQAELAALRYKTSIGRPGFLHSFAVVVALRLISRADISCKLSRAGGASS